MAILVVSESALLRRRGHLENKRQEQGIRDKPSLLKGEGGFNKLLNMREGQLGEGLPAPHPPLETKFKSP
jgi:hypothetical protein